MPRTKIETPHGDDEAPSTERDLVRLARRARLFAVPLETRTGTSYLLVDRHSPASDPLALRFESLAAAVSALRAGRRAIARQRRACGTRP